MKDIVLFLFGIIAGFLFSIAIYWVPLNQFCNELKALYQLVFVKFPNGSLVKLKRQISLRTNDFDNLPTTGRENLTMHVVRDEGVNWFRDNTTWKRARTIIVATSPATSMLVTYKVQNND